MKVLRKQVTLNTTRRPDRIHPLHLLLSEKDAKKLNVPSGETVSFLSVTAKKYEIDSSNPNTPFQSEVDTPPKDSKHDSYSFFPPKSKRQSLIESYTSDTEDVDIIACTWVDDDMLKEILMFTGEIDEENDTNTDDDDNPDDDITVYCSPDFLSHYQISPDENIYVKVTNIYPIEKLVIGVTDFSTFKWLKKAKFSTGLLTEVCSHEILIRSNDIFLASYPKMFLEDPSFRTSMYFDMHVLESCPLKTGKLTLNTQLVISLVEDSDDEDNLAVKLQSPTRTTKSRDHFLISDFCQALKPDVLALNAKTIGLSHVQRSFSSSQIFGYEIIQQHASWRKLFSKTQRKHTFDPLYVIGMSKQTMIHNGFFEESIVEVSMGDSFNYPESATLSSRLAQVKCVLEESEGFSKVFISPLLLFNLQNCSPSRHEPTKTIRIQKYNLEGTDVDIGTSSFSLNAILPIAREVHISIVTSPYYSPRAIHTEAIKTYFQVPRLVTKGDILPFRSKDDPEYEHALTDSDKRNPVVFFKVVKVDGPQTLVPCYICDQQKTRLVQVGSVHSYIPMMMTSYLSHDALTYWDQTYLHGMNRYADKLELLIRPHLQHKLDNPSLKEVLPSIMLTGPSGCGKTTLAVTVARRLNLHIHKVNCHSLYGEASGAIEARIKNVFNAASTYSPCILFLHSIHALGKDKERNTNDPRVASSFKLIVSQLKNEYLEFPVVVIGTTNSRNSLATDVQEAFLHEVQIEVPTENDRQEMLDGLLQNVCYSGDVTGQYLAQRTAGFVLGDMAALVAHAKREAYQHIYKLCAGGRKMLSYDEEEEISMAGIVLQQDDFVRALDKLQAAHSDSIGAPKIPNVTWDDVGGLADVKSDILDTIQLPLQYPELLAAGLRRSGVLLYGPPGTGKTLLAKAVATECSLNFLSVKGPELINMYVGQSEENVREVFHRARSATPCVIFFDELDSLAPNRGKSGDSGGVMDRVVSQLLAELDGLHKSCDVFVIGATNRPDLLDPALLRPGRFDKMLYLGISEDSESQIRIIKALTRKFKLADDLDMEKVVENCPKNLTGADLYALCSDAMLNALKSKIQQLEKGETTDQTNVVVTHDDFMAALSALTPSVSAMELRRYKELKDYFTGKK